MISFRYFALILGLLCLREAATQSTAAFHWLAAVSVVVSLVFGFAILTKAAALRAVQQSTINGVQFDWLAKEYFFRVRGKIELFWCLLSPLVMLMTGWFSWTGELERTGWAQSIVLAACFAPTLVLLALIELIGAQVDQLQLRATVDHKSMVSAILQSWKTRLRLGEISGLITCLTPVILVASISDLSGFVSTQLDWDKAIVSTSLTITLALLFIAIFPLLFTRLSGGQILTGEIATRVERLLRESGVKGTPANLICSGGRWAGAAIVGWAPGCRRLWLGDGLISLLTPRELDMVVLHEAAHVKRHHFVWRLFPVIWSICAGLVIWLVADRVGFENSLAIKIVAAITSSLLLLFGLGDLARRCELDADRTACNLAEQIAPWSAETSPADVLGAALAKLLEGSPSQKRTWLHPSLDQRLENLRDWNQARTKAIPGPMRIGDCSA